MARCGSCSATIFFGGVTEGDQRFCNATCQQNYRLTLTAFHIPLDVVQKELTSVHQGPCPRCAKAGPVDIHNAYKVWSLFVLTRWSTQPQLSCRSCGRKAQAEGLIFSFIAGWWGFPWGIILTPIQICRNIAAMAGGPDGAAPSKLLETHVRTNLAALAIAKGFQPPAGPPKIPR